MLFHQLTDAYDFLADHLCLCRLIVWATDENDEFLLFFGWKKTTKNYVPFTNGSRYVCVCVCVQRSPWWPMLKRKTIFCCRCPPHKRLRFVFGGKSICPILTHWRIRLKPEISTERGGENAFRFFLRYTRTDDDATAEPKQPMLERLGLRSVEIVDWEQEVVRGQIEEFFGWLLFSFLCVNGDCFSSLVIKI